MQEQQNRQQGLGMDERGGFDAFGTTAGTVLVSHGTYLEHLPVVGLTVAQIRGRFQDRLDIHPEATTLLDGHPADDSIQVHAGQTLMFVRPSGEKGAMRTQASKSVLAPPATVTFEGDRARATLPEGESVSVGIAELLERLGAVAGNGGATMLPDGVKCLIPMPGGCIAVHQRPPCIFNFKWIAPGSRAEYGTGTSYRQVRLALPYLVVLAPLTDSATSLGVSSMKSGSWTSAATCA